MDSGTVVTLVTVFLLIVALLILFVVVGYFGIKFIDWLEEKTSERKSN
jgi:hypothetical protein